MSDNVYFAAKEPEKAAQIILHKANAWYNQVYTNGYLIKVRDSWLAYHGAHYSSASAAHKISFAGEQGELVQIAINHYRNIAEHIITMITANRPAFQARATNTDSKSTAQTKLANGLLDYYMREKRMEKYLHRAVEYAVVLGSGFIKMEWNATTGETYDVNEETGAMIQEGDVEFTNLSPYDVVFDTSKETSENHDWVLCRSFKNKFDLAAKFPELADKIKGMQTKSDLMKFRFEMFAFDQTEDVAIYEFYHRKTESMPKGRYLSFLDDNMVLMDTPLPYRALPVYRIAPSDILGTPYGYTSMFDLLPIQEALNSLYSTVLTNQHAFGVQNVYVPRGADISLKSLEGGLNIIEGNSGAGKPEAMNLTATPPEVFNFIKQLEQQMETISGVNSVARGNPEASLKSGTALALVQSMALQFISGLQQQYVQLVEDVGTGLVNMLKDFAAVPRIAAIAGKNNKAYVEREFTGDDLSQVNRVIVDIGNPIARTTAGKMQMATELIQYNIIKTPEQYINVMTTGNLDNMTDDVQDGLIIIQNENEALSDKRPVRALAIDQHLTHIKGHRGILSDPELRMDEELTDAVLAHIQEHLNLLRNTDPALLSLIGEQPLGPAGGTPPGPQQPGVNPGSAPSGGPMEAQPPMQQPPSAPNMPQVDNKLLSNPQLQQNALNNVK
jgi:carbon monoxide dehydrogenase subunit G